MGRVCARHWRWCWVLAFGLLCVYMAFDTLDVDGSAFQAPFGQTRISALSDPIETDPLSRGDIPTFAFIATPKALAIASRERGDARSQPRSRARSRLPRGSLCNSLLSDSSVDPA